MDQRGEIIIMEKGTELPENAETIDQIAEELHVAPENPVHSLTPKQIKQIQRAAARSGRGLVCQADFTRKQHDKDKAKKLRKLQKAARKKQRK